MEAEIPPADTGESAEERRAGAAERSAGPAARRRVTLEGGEAELGRRGAMLAGQQDIGGARRAVADREVLDLVRDRGVEVPARRLQRAASASYASYAFRSSSSAARRRVTAIPASP